MVDTTGETFGKKQDLGRVGQGRLVILFRG